MDNRFRQQIDFIIEIDKVKSIFRKTSLFDGSRQENDAEHAWHIAIMAAVFSEYANDKNIDINKVIKMLLIHDLVEIDAGDIAVYDTKAREENAKNEKEAAERIFGLLPEDQKNEMIELWNEFEEQNSPEAKFAAALDRLEPVLQNYMTNGQVWKKLNVPHEKVINVNRHVKEGSEKLWEYMQSIIDETFEKF